MCINGLKSKSHQIVQYIFYSNTSDIILLIFLLCGIWKKDQQNIFRSQPHCHFCLSSLTLCHCDLWWIWWRYEIKKLLQNYFSSFTILHAEFFICCNFKNMWKNFYSFFYDFSLSCKITFLEFKFKNDFFFSKGFNDLKNLFYCHWELKENPTCISFQAHVLYWEYWRMFWWYSRRYPGINNIFV